MKYLNFNERHHGQKNRPLNFSSRKELKYFINSDKYVKDIETIQKSKLLDHLILNSEVSRPRNISVSRPAQESQISSKSSLQKKISLVVSVLNNDKLGSDSINTDITDLPPAGPLVILSYRRNFIL